MVSDEKGQITVEAILILGFFMLIFIGVTVPMAFNARSAAIDTSVLADAKFATEQIAGAAGTVIVNGSRRTINVYVPGYKSGGINIGTRICTDGSYINTTVAINRSTSGMNQSRVIESYNISAKLFGTGWTLTNPAGGAYISENKGTRYTIVIEYKSINSATANSLALTNGCTGDFTGDL
ncbi:hypothetical protein BMS3Abin16_00746 [archaeon BMS3Abin16]|nr:hypothetical protein BMS3Abin16_00746 [archaeon BMS3Abin16]